MCLLRLGAMPCNLPLSFPGVVLFPIRAHVIVWERDRMYVRAVNKEEREISEGSMSRSGKGGFSRLESHELEQFAGMQGGGDSESEVELDLRGESDTDQSSRRWVEPWGRAPAGYPPRVYTYMCTVHTIAQIHTHIL